MFSINYFVSHRHNYAIVLGTCYRTLKCYLLVGAERGDGESVPVFGRLDDVLQVEGSIIFVCRRMRTVVFDSHFGAYVVEDIPSNAYSCFFATSLKCHYLFSIVEISKSMYIKSKYDLSGYMQYAL